MSIKVIKYSPLPYLVADDKPRYEAQALMFQNSGTSTVIIGDNWTLPPGATLQLGRTDDENTVILHEQIKFDQTAGNINRLEIMVANC